MRWLLVLGLSTLTVAACSAAAPSSPAEPPRPPQPSTPAASAPPAASSEPEPAPEPSGAAAPPALAASAAPAAEGPTACPAGMQLVEGDYCTEVEHKCLKSWFDKSNKKVVCELFEPSARCVGAKVKKRYCIDTYEWPNKKGERPEVMNYFYQAQVKCAAAGKRMCTESEWTLACEGPEMKPFPYGFVRDAAKCNGDHDWDEPNMKKVAKRDPTELARLWQGVPSGSQPNCISDFGGADLPANADEVVASETRTADFRGKFDSIHTGGPWYRGVRNQCRPKVYTHNEEFYYYFLGFRCCAEPDGAKTDPRTPRQIEKGWKFDRVEKYARFTTEAMKEKLELKAQGACTCAPKDTLCKTMCGTLLGPGAVDAKPGAVDAKPGAAAAARKE